MSPAGAAYAESVTRAPGAAPWLVLVHGATQSRTLFSAQVDALAPRYRLLLVDLPGHGGSRDLPGPYGLEEYADAVLAATNSRGLERFHYWGTHTGTAVGLLLAARHPGRFRTLVLEGAVLPGTDMPSVTAALDRARATARAAGLAAARAEWIETSEWFRIIRERPEACRADAYRALTEDFEGGPWLDDATPRPVAPLADRLGRIRCPVLLLNGEHDVEDFVAVADRLERALPDVERVVIPGAGGFPLWEYPAPVNVCVGHFLATHDD